MPQVGQRWSLTDFFFAAMGLILRLFSNHRFSHQNRNPAGPNHGAMWKWGLAAPVGD
jgi:hypothetical protein